MVYNKQQHVNRLVDRPNTYTITQNTDGTAKILPAWKQIAGTPVDEVRLNHMEDGIESAHKSLEEKVNAIRPVFYGYPSIKAFAPDDHVFLQFYPDKDNPSKREAHIGFPNNSTIDFTLANEKVDGGINLLSNGAGKVLVNNQQVFHQGNPEIQNNPNLLKNSTGRFGLLGWSDQSGKKISVVKGSEGEGDYFATRVGAAANERPYLSSDFIDMKENTPLSLSGEMQTIGITSGAIYLEVQYYKADGTLINSKNVTAQNGRKWSFYFFTATTPALTAKVKVLLAINPSTTLTNAAWRKIKLEAGTKPTPYSVEGDLGFVLAPEVNLTNGTKISETVNQRTALYAHSNRFDVLSQNGSNLILSANAGDRSFKFLNSEVMRADNMAAHLASDSLHGFMSSADKQKLDTISSYANYFHNSIQWDLTPKNGWSTANTNEPASAGLIADNEDNSGIVILMGELTLASTPQQGSLMATLMLMHRPRYFTEVPVVITSLSAKEKLYQGYIFIDHYTGDIQLFYNSNNPPPLGGIRVIFTGASFRAKKT
ncbi:hypothetical protein LOY85_24200 [Brevibacillus brevis]|uniref:hypothetical protein n=1 Tax=Brevibacillus brevis TaxID=1393 RepID=UPI001F26CD3F|nr:hypothetical protein [Brevibacillus brevis]UIO41864.1 hypothetical protein LOY85_24200 [Brevibacillus brevis]